jgi:sterol desaturase/sphingolipid hydroxylase (fatty acid hydroxylase superfamily)
MDLKQQLLLGLPVFLAPILIDLGVGALRRKPVYRLNDLLTNLTLSLLTVLSSLVITGLTLAIYTFVLQRFALFELSLGSGWTWLVAFLAYDFFYYWAHWAHHRMAWLWAIHVVHHSGEDMNFGLAVRQSALGEATTWPFFIPLALLGVPLEAYLGAALVQLLFQYSIHNTYVPALGWLEKVLVTPSQHRVHHSRNRLYIDKNYGNVLVLWDLLFRTYQPELAEQPPVYGLRSSVRTWNPFTLHFHEFADMFRKAAACGSVLDKVRCLFKGPDWQPPSLRRERFAGHPDDGPSATYRKYDPPLARASAAYCVAQFLGLTTSVVLLVWNLDALSALAVATGCGLILLSAMALSRLLEGQASAWRFELGRLTAVALLGTGLLLHEGQPLPRVLTLLVCVALSGAYLLRFRSAFLEPARAPVREWSALAG